MPSAKNDLQWKKTLLARKQDGRSGSLSASDRQGSSVNAACEHGHIERAYDSQPHVFLFEEGRPV
jgi:hypothetical protein